MCSSDDVASNMMFKWPWKADDESGNAEMP
ncbi:DgsA anti-repressor MtfA, partial [Acinetobacter baumannii]|nr:DgsA anti-repressor MtfA [Acinetobacter baumannii]